MYDIFMQPANVKIKVVNKPSAAAQIPMNPVVLDSKMQKELLQEKYEKLRHKGVKP